MSNSLTRRVSLTIGPLFLETLVKHYFARVVSDDSKTGVPLRREALLYDEAFNIVKVLPAVRSHVDPIEHCHSSKDFLDVATRYIPNQLTAGIEMLSFHFSIQGTRSKNCKPSQTCAPRLRRGSMSSASSFPWPPAMKPRYILSGHSEART